MVGLNTCDCWLCERVVSRDSISRGLCHRHVLFVVIIFHPPPAVYFFELLLVVECEVFVVAVTLDRQMPEHRLIASRTSHVTVFWEICKKCSEHEMDRFLCVVTVFGEQV